MEPTESYQAVPQSCQEYVNVFHEVTKAVASAYKLDKVLDLIVHKLAETLGVQAATVRLFDEKSSKLELRAACGVSESYLARGPVDTEKSVGEVLDGRPVSVYDAPNDPRIQYREEARKEGIKSILGVPIIAREKVLGVLRLLSREHREFLQDEIRFVVSLAEHCGIAIEQAADRELLLKQVNRLEALHEIAETVNATLNINRVAESIVTELPKIMNVQAVTVRVLDQQNKKLRLVAACGLSDKYLNRGAVDSEESIKLVLAGKPVAIKDATTDQRIQYTAEAREEGIASILAVPITAMGRVLGVLRLLATTPRDFSSEEIQFVTAVAAQKGLATRNAMRHEEMRNLFRTIQDERRFLQQIIDSLDVQLLAMGRDDRVILVNEPYARARNLTKEAILGQRFEALEPHDVSSFPGQEETDPLDRARKARMPQRFKRVQEDFRGEIRRFEITVVPIVDSEGELESVIQTKRDVTAQWQHEKLALESERIRTALEMSGTLAHELNTPLFSALGTTQILAKDYASDEKLSQSLEIVLRNLTRTSDLTKKMTRLTDYRTRSYLDGRNLIDIDAPR